MALTAVTLANDPHKKVSTTLVVRNLAEVTAALKATGDDAGKELQLSLKDIAKHVIGVADQRMPWGPPSLHAKQSALQPRATAKGAGIAFPAGGADSRDDPLGYYPWLDFGGTVGRGRVSAGYTLTRSKTGKITAHASHQRASVAGARGRVMPKGGGYLYPAIAESSKLIGDEAYKAIKRAADRHDVQTRGL